MNNLYVIKANDRYIEFNRIVYLDTYSFYIGTREGMIYSYYRKYIFKTERDAIRWIKSNFDIKKQYKSKNNYAFGARYEYQTPDNIDKIK